MMHDSVFSSSRHPLIGAHVFSNQGEPFGTLEEIMIDTLSGEIAYALLSLIGRKEKKKFAISWHAFHIENDLDHVVLNPDKVDLWPTPGLQACD